MRRLHLWRFQAKILSRRNFTLISKFPTLDIPKYWESFIYKNNVAFVLKIELTSIKFRHVGFQIVSNICVLRIDRSVLLEIRVYFAPPLAPSSLLQALYTFKVGENPWNYGNFFCYRGTVDGRAHVNVHESLVTLHHEVGESLDARKRGGRGTKRAEHRRRRLENGERRTRGWVGGGG